MSGGVDPQQVYAAWLQRGVRFALAFCVVALVLYLSGVLAPQVPLASLPRMWSSPAETSGWTWLATVHRGDSLTLAAIALFSTLTLACYARVVPALLGRGERLHAWLAIAQVIVLLAAASGVLVAGH
jgi:hypothetical protein